jgi:hypothetical protein
MKPRWLTVFVDPQYPTPNKIKTYRREMSGRYAWRQARSNSRNLSLVFRRECRGLRVVEPDRDEPVAGGNAVTQTPQEAGAVFDVRCRIERLLQSGEGIGMRPEIDLHATHIKESHGSGSQGFVGPRDRLGLAGKKHSMPVHIDRPRPWLQGAGGRPLSTFAIAASRPYGTS